MELDAYLANHAVTFKMLYDRGKMDSGVGILFVDVSSSRAKYLPLKSVEPPPVREKVVEILDDKPDGVVYVCMDEGAIHILLQPDEEPTASDDDVPFVTVVTPTRNRRAFASNAIKNFMTQKYPKEKMELLILDDGNEEDWDLPEDKRIRYERCKGMTIGEKRNECVRRAKHDIIVHMDDDDYYPPHSVSVRVKKLASSNVVGCLSMFVYDKVGGDAYYYDGDLNGIHTLKEGSLAYSKNAWDIQPFPKDATVAEGCGFMLGRDPYVIGILSPDDIICCIAHGKNTVEKRFDCMNKISMYQLNYKP